MMSGSILGIFRKTAVCVLASTLSVAFNVQVVSAEPPPLIYLNGKTISSEVSPIIVDGRVLVPLRVISDQLGYVVRWDPGARMVYVNTAAGSEATASDSNEIRLMIHGSLVAADVSPRIVQHRVMVPIRSIAESMNAVVHWQADTKQVMIVHPDKLRQDTLRAIDNFLYWIDASYEYPDNGTPDDFSAWMTEKGNAIRESRQLVSALAAFLAQLPSEMTSNPLYDVIQEASTLMEYERENIIFQLIHANAYEKLKEIAVQLQ